MAKTKAVVVDIDGTLLLENGLPNYKLIDLINRFYTHLKLHIIILTARKHIYRKETINELKTYGIKYHKLIMNQTKLVPPTYKKQAMIRELLPNYDVVKIYDDDDSIIDVFKKMQLNVIPVDEMTGSFRIDL